MTITHKPLPAPDVEKKIRLECANCTAAEYNFIKGVVELFADPDRRDDVDRLKAGNASIRFPLDGTPWVTDDFMPN